MIELVTGPLRYISSIAAALDIPMKFLVFVLSLAILVVSLLAFQKSKSNKFIFIAIAFFLFAAKWFLKILDIFLSPGIFLPDSSENVFELCILAALLIGIFKK